MKNRESLFLVAGFLAILFLRPSPLSWALDLGAAAAVPAAEPQKVEVVNKEPVKVAETDVSRLVEIIGSAQVEADDEYRSPYIDVQGYKTVSFYVLPEKVLNEPHADIHYRLDAFFTVDTGMTNYKKFGEDNSKVVGGGGSDEFGMMTVHQDGSAENPVFFKPTTGETSSRVLTTPVYGPYVRVVLKNLTEDERRKFRIVAYMTR